MFRLPDFDIQLFEYILQCSVLRCVLSCKCQADLRYDLQYICICENDVWFRLGFAFIMIFVSAFILGIPCNEGFNRKKFEK